MSTYFVRALSVGYLGLINIALFLGSVIDLPRWLGLALAFLGLTCVFAAGWAFLTTPEFWSDDEDKP